MVNSTPTPTLSSSRRSRTLHHIYLSFGSPASLHFAPSSTTRLSNLITHVSLSRLIRRGGAPKFPYNASLANAAVSGSGLSCYLRRRKCQVSFLKKATRVFVGASRAGAGRWHSLGSRVGLCCTPSSPVMINYISSHCSEMERYMLCCPPAVPARGCYFSLISPSLITFPTATC